MNEIHETLDRIHKVATPLLRDGCTIADIVYRPADFGVFGGEGFSLVLSRPPNFSHGMRFRDAPSDNDIAAAVIYAQNIIAPRETKSK